MIVKFKCGDSITIPEGCKAIVKGKSVVFDKEEKEELQEFKDGDVLCSTLDDLMLIFKATHKHARSYFDSHYNNKGSGDEHWNIEFFRHATEEEKKLFFDKLKEKGLRWNAEEKKVEKIRWRAEDGEGYFYVDNQGHKIAKNEECKFVDEDRYAFGNYFRTIDQANEAAKRVREALRQYHEEIGE